MHWEKQYTEEAMTTNQMWNQSSVPQKVEITKSAINS